MNILICGASGFVGKHIRDALQKAGHHVTGGIRQPQDAHDIAVDFCKDTTKDICSFRTCISCAGESRLPDQAGF
ncbi:NAD-dependent epimerase/dehydratase family protein [Mariprofundus sp. KV]|nr:NAD-dependent epimerase/dehydratase family protein [Mariprofundus sp. KV]